MEKYQIVQVKSYPSLIKSATKNINLTQDINTSQTQNNSRLSFQKQYSNANHRNKYGKMKVLFQNDQLLFTLGPNYLCFLITYICFSVLNFFMITFVWGSTQLIVLKILNAAISILQNLSYLSVALSNPGMQTKQTLPTDQDVSQEVNRYCKVCQIPMQKKTYHCRECDVCIREYDHHCPWISKCIGQKNIKKFHIFVCVTPCYIFYSIIVFMICMVNNEVTNNQALNHKI